MALWEPRFWLLTFAFAASTFAGVTMTVHVIPYLSSRGHSAVAGGSVAGALLYVALFGIGSGVLTIMRAALLAEHYGPANYGAINGAQNLALTGARTAAPVGAGLLVGTLGGYDALLWGLMCLLMLGAGAVVLSSASARPPSGPGWRSWRPSPSARLRPGQVIIRAVDTAGLRLILAHQEAEYHPV